MLGVPGGGTPLSWRFWFLAFAWCHPHSKSSVSWYSSTYLLHFAHLGSSKEKHSSLQHSSKLLTNWLQRPVVRCFERSQSNGLCFVQICRFKLVRGGTFKPWASLVSWWFSFEQQMRKAEYFRLRKGTRMPTCPTDVFDVLPQPPNRTKILDLPASQTHSLVEHKKSLWRQSLLR